MSMHPSLKASEKGKKQRSVLKRIERLKFLMGKEKWKEGDPVYGLPKIKAVKIKIKKEKAEKAPESAAAAASTATAAAKPAETSQKEAKK
ncbi:MAG: small basic protein [Candidatus Omnitrophica bacterium]|nr:small basic protein [Candidatus Omnitrophota bacterium]